MSTTPAAVAAKSASAPAKARISRRRELARVAILAAAIGYAITLVWHGGLGLGLLVAADAGAGLAMWRAERVRAPISGRLLENLGYLSVFAATVTLTMITRPDWIGDFASWPWYLVAVGAGFGLILASGMSVPALWSGSMAFAMGAKPSSQAAVSGLNMSIGAVAEEILYRSAALRPMTLGLPVSLLAGAVFVGKHHLPRWSARRGSRRAYLTEIAAAVIFGVLTVLSRSLYPAIIAHLVNNGPSIWLQVQRGRQREES